jgi:multiple antibiotic resistance protein
MTTFPSDFFHELVTLVVILDPLATVPVFLAVTAGLSATEKRRVAFHAVVIAMAILTVAIAGGQLLLEALGIPMASFQLAGSIVLFLLGIDMVTGRLVKEIDAFPPDTPIVRRALYPLATPIIAGSGAILTVVLLTDNATRTVAEQVRTVGTAAIALSINYLAFLAASRLSHFIGPTGIEATTRIFGLVLTAIAVNGALIALRASFAL